MVRLWENGLSETSLIDIKEIRFVKIVDVFQETSNVLRRVEDSQNTEKGSSEPEKGTMIDSISSCLPQYPFSWPKMLRKTEHWRSMGAFKYLCLVQ